MSKAPFKRLKSCSLGGVGYGFGVEKDASTESCKAIQLLK